MNDELTEFANEWFPQRLAKVMRHVGDGPSDGSDASAVADAFWAAAKERGLTDLEYERTGPTFACRQCRDETWVETGQLTVRPCSVCRPDQYARWDGGHLASGHDKQSCLVCSGRPQQSDPFQPPRRRDLE